MLRLLILFCILSSEALAIEYEFDGGRITAVGGITDQPAGIGYLDSKYSFAASASALEFTSYNVENNSFEQNNSPMRFKPVFVGSAMSTSYGGWSFLVFNTDTEYIAALTSVSGGKTTDSKISIRLKSFKALVSAGYRIHRNWSLGWGLALSQTQIQTNTETSNTGGANESFAVIEGLSQATTGHFNMGTLFTLEDFVLGLKVSPPATLLTKSAKIRTRTLVSPNTYTDVVEDGVFDINNVWEIEAGIRFGRSGFSYLLSDSYSTNGQHIFNFGFDYVGGWGSIASGFSYSDFQNEQISNLSVGFVKDHKNFKWGIGPNYRVERDSNPGSLNSKTFGIYYSSEIRY